MAGIKKLAIPDGGSAGVVLADELSKNLRFDSGSIETTPRAGDFAADPESIRRLPAPLRNNSFTRKNSG